MSEIDTSAKRLKLLRSTLSITQKKLSEVLECSQAKVSDYESGKLSMSNADMTTIAKSYSVNLNWLLTGTGQMFESQKHLVSAIEEQANTIVELKHAASVRIPVVGCIAAGPPLEITDIEPLDYVTLDRSIIRYPDDYVAFQVDGDSMFPEIKHGDVVLIHRRYDYGSLHQSIIAVQINGENTLKIIHVDDAHRQSILYPINSRKHRSIVLDEDTADNVIILGQLVMLVRKYL
jgi:SOS-response transcriptional repressor LexA